jgi:predicted transcriptional regulator
MARYRSRLEIVADVLGVVSGGARKTQVMYQANLSYRLLTRYLKDVMDMGLVRVEDGNTYELTEKGADFLLEFKGYHGRRVEVEEKLNDVEDEKVMLENRFLNAKGVDVGSKNCSRKKGEKKSVG